MGLCTLPLGVGRSCVQFSRARRRKTGTHTSQNSWGCFSVGTASADRDSRFTPPPTPDFRREPPGRSPISPAAAIGDRGPTWHRLYPVGSAFSVAAHIGWSRILDNEAEFTAKAVRELLDCLGVKTLNVELGSPWKNGYVKSFNGRLREELLDREIFYTLRQASGNEAHGGARTSSTG